MPVLETFAAALGDLTDPRLSGVEMLPTRLSLATARALGVDGAGVSVTDHLRVPLGASSEISTAAERLQATTGSGPCIDAAAAGLTLTATQDEIATRWPLFYADLVVSTPFRSVFSTPLRSTDGAPFGALDLYSREPLGILRVATCDAEEVASAVARVLLADPVIDIAPDLVGPAWLGAPAARTRMTLWAAIGMINASQHLSEEDSLAVLRAAAFARGITIDELAVKLSNQQLPVEELTAG